jgi:hypothetical protein
MTMTMTAGLRQRQPRKVAALQLAAEHLVRVRVGVGVGVGVGG